MIGLSSDLWAFQDGLPFTVLPVRGPGRAAYSRPMEGYDPAEAAQRSGIGVDELNRLVELGILTPAADNRFTAGHLRRAAW